jgi:TPR repeat protein
MDLYQLTIEADNGDIDSILKINNICCFENEILKMYNDEFTKYLYNNVDSSKPYTMLYIGLYELYKNNDLEQAEIYLRKSKKLGCSQAYVELATLSNNNSLKHNYNSNELIQKALEMNNSNAYIYIWINSNNDKSNLDILTHAVNMNNICAIYNMATYYHDEEQFELAIKYYEMGCELGCHRCYLNLGMMYSFGEYVVKDTIKALGLLKKSSKLGSIRAYVCIGTIYANSKNYINAKKYYKMAAVHNDPVALANLSLIYKIQNNQTKMFKYLLRSAKAGHFESQTELLKYGIYTDSDIMTT